MRRKSKDRNATLRFLLQHPALWFVVATFALVFVGMFLWQEHRHRFLQLERYAITSEKINLGTIPNWSVSLTRETLNEFEQQEHSLLDPKVVLKVKDHFHSNPWIQSVESIQKRSAGLDVSLAFREPIAIADSLDGTSFAVDGEGFVFDDSVLDYTAVARLKSGMLKINMPRLDLSSCLPWHSVCDSRLPFATRLAAWVNEFKDEFGFYRVITYSSHQEQPEQGPILEIWTQNGTRVIWGHAPGLESSNEAEAVDKLAAIRQYVQKFGELAEFSQRRTHAIDISSGAPTIIKDTRLAQMSGWSRAFQ